MKEQYDKLPPVAGLNFVELSPISFLTRTADTYPDHPSIIYLQRKYTWKQTAQRCAQLASGLNKLGVAVGTTVSMMAANTPELVEAHYGIPMAGGVINAINTRLDATTVAYILEHSDCKILITDTHFSPIIKAALTQLPKPPIVIDIIDKQVAPPEGGGEQLGQMTYEELLASGSPSEGITWLPKSEWDAIALNYTSGTSGRPKGVVYHHRGAYLMSMGTIAAWQIPRHPRYLYTVPLFHCSGWGHLWTMTVMGGTIVCNRVVRAQVTFDAIEQYQITHFGAAPIILSMLINAPPEVQKRMDYTVQVMTGGAPPPATVLKKMEQLGFNITHIYGLTETYGHVLYCENKVEWANLDSNVLAELKARQGVRLHMMESVQVHSVGSDKKVAADGATIGEIVFTGNAIMKGYYKNPDATTEAFANGWLHSGDLAVMHPDGYIEIKDRLKDIIISGGENISSIEVESALYKHPKIAVASVVAKPDEKWGETPCAFVELLDNASVSEEDIITFCRQHLSSFMCPKKIVFMEIPKTATGKIQKFKLREIVRNGEV